MLVLYMSVYAVQVCLIVCTVCMHGFGHTHHASCREGGPVLAEKSGLGDSGEKWSDFVI